MLKAIKIVDFTKKQQHNSGITNLGITWMADILVLHGPNLNLLGQREPNLYGASTLEEINHRLINIQAKTSNYTLDIQQSNAEHELLNLIHQAAENNTKFILFNPAAFTHTSIALRDALLAVNIPFIEIHLSNIYQREAFRQQSYFSDIAVGSITGLGAQGYELALSAANNYLTQNS